MYHVYLNDVAQRIICMFNKPASMHTVHTRYTNINFFVSPVLTNVTKNFIIHAGVVLWNRLPSDCKLVKCLKMFKTIIKHNIFDQYI
jgi:hypothetical protein